MRKCDWYGPKHCFLSWWLAWVMYQPSMEWQKKKISCYLLVAQKISFSFFGGWLVRCELVLKELVSLACKKQLGVLSRCVRLLKFSLIRIYNVAKKMFCLISFHFSWSFSCAFSVCYKSVALVCWCFWYPDSSEISEQDDPAQEHTFRAVKSELNSDQDVGYHWAILHHIVSNLEFSLSIVLFFLCSHFS